VENQAQICEKLTRYLAGDCTPEEVQEISTLLESNVDAVDLFADLLLQSTVIRDAAQETPKQAAKVIPFPKRSHSWVWPVALAASLTVVVLFQNESRWIAKTSDVAGTTRWTGNNGKVLDNIPPDFALTGGTIETLSDEASVSLVFRDGTRVALANHSAATISNDGQKRVLLRQGNLTADVAPQPKGHPMLIQTNTASFEIVGTVFDIQADANAALISVNHGIVRTTRLVDGSVAEVRSQQQVLATGTTTEALIPVPIDKPVSSWKSDLNRYAKEMTGEWVSASESKPAFLRATHQAIVTKKGCRNIYGVGFRLPWKRSSAIQPTSESKLRIRGRTNNLSVDLEMMLFAETPSHIWAGSFFARKQVGPNSFEIELPISDFRKWSYSTKALFPSDVRIRAFSIYSIDVDANLEIEEIAVVTDEETDVSNH